MTKNTCLEWLNQVIPQPVKYIVTGGAAFVVDYAMYWAVTCFAHFQVATVVGLLSGLFINFVMSKLWVFEDKQPVSRDEVTLFMLVTAFGFLLTFFGMHIGVDVLTMNDKAVRIATAFIVFGMNYFSRKYIIYKEV